MQDGKLLEVKPRDTFFVAAEHAYSRQLLNSVQQNHLLPFAEKSHSLLKVEALKVWFPVRKGLFRRHVNDTRAVNGISFEIARGETLALVGESGCGKTTIGKALLGLVPVTDGCISFQGKQGMQRIDHLDGKSFSPFRKSLQIIFQDPFSSMNPRFCVRQIIEEGLQYLQPDLDQMGRRLRVEELIERVGLKQDHLGRFPHEFSGGQRQRIAIARALAVNPRLIICDEPTSALDVSIREQILALLKKLQEEEGLSYLFITHDLSLIPRIAHRVAVMRNGQIIEQGSVGDVMDRPQQEYTKTLLAAAPQIGINRAV
jgi:peptide/nickel transport system ATP-binding protein